MKNTTTLVKVQFRTKLSNLELQKVSAEDMPALEQVPGLVYKIYHVNSGSGKPGAVYHFEDEISADNYIASPRMKNMADRYRIIRNTLEIEKVNVVHVLEGKRNTMTQKV
jgi:hypothetical protein